MAVNMKNPEIEKRIQEVTKLLDECREIGNEQWTDTESPIAFMFMVETPEHSASMMFDLFCACD